MNFLTRDPVHGASTLTLAERNVFEMSPFGVMERDTGNRLIYANAAAIENYGVGHRLRHQFLRQIAPGHHSGAHDARLRDGGRLGSHV